MLKFYVIYIIVFPPQYISHPLYFVYGIFWQTKFKYFHRVKRYLFFIYFHSISYMKSPSFNGMEKAMAPHSSALAWRIPWTEEPGGQQSMGSRRVGHDWATSFSLSTFMHWRRKWQPTPVLLSGESQGRGSLVGYCLWGCTELDMTEVT